MTNETQIGLKGTIFLSSEGCVPSPDSGKNPNGIFIYDYQEGDLTDVNMVDLGNPSFIVATIPGNFVTSDIETMASELDSSNLQDSPLFGLAIQYTGPQATNPLASIKEKISQLENYVDLFNKTEGWNFRPVVCLEREACLRQTINGLEISLNQQLQYIEQETNYRPVIQVSWDVANEYLTDPIFKNYPLWLTGVQNSYNFSLPGSWKHHDWTIVESGRYSEQGLIDGKNTDFREIIFSTNRYNGDSFALQQFSSGITTTSISGNRRLKL